MLISQLKWKTENKGHYNNDKLQRFKGYSHQSYKMSGQQVSIK